MADTKVSIGQVKRDLSDLVNRVAYGRERIVLTSRGKPKAALVSMEDYQRLEDGRIAARVAHWRAWLSQCDALTADILARPEGPPLDVEALWNAVRAEREERSAELLDG